MYKWPKGRVIRTISLVLVLAITADLAFNGAWPQISTYFDEGSGAGLLRPLIIGCIYAILALGLLVGGVAAVGFKPVSVDFLIDVEEEMTRVTWPTGSELIRSTIVITVMIAVLGIAIFTVDWFNLKVLFEALYGSGA